MKNWKKGITLLLAFALIMSLAACGANKQGGGMEENGDGAFASAEDCVYGKITKIAGNEIEVAVAKKQEGVSDGVEDIDLDGVMVPGENDLPVIGGSGEDGDAGEVEFTGESLSLVIPAGVKIYSMGQEINLSTLKKGDMVSVTLDAEDHDRVLSMEKVD